VPWEPKTGFQGKESLSMARSKYPKYGRKERKSRTNDGFFSSLPERTPKELQTNGFGAYHRKIGSCLLPTDRTRRTRLDWLMRT
jgi:hypothetical protein